MVKSEYCRRSYRYLTVVNFEFAYDFDQKSDECKVEYNYVYPKTREKLR